MDERRLWLYIREVVVKTAEEEVVVERQVFEYRFLC